MNGLGLTVYVSRSLWRGGSVQCPHLSLVWRCGDRGFLPHRFNVTKGVLHGLSRLHSNVAIPRNRKPITPRALGCIHRQIGLAKHGPPYLSKWLSAVRQTQALQMHARADGHLMGRSIDQQGSVPNRLHKPFRHLGGTLRIGMRERDHKLLAAIAREQLHLPQLLAQDLGNMLQHQVPEGAPE